MRSDNKIVVPQYKEDDFKYILLWNTFFRDSTFEFKNWIGENWISRKTFHSIKCPETKCFLTNRRNYFFDTSLFDAVIFHERNLNIKDLPDSRKQNQLYVHYNLESPVWSPIRGISNYSQFFNLSMSYRQDSDFPIPYGRFVKKNNSLPQNLYETIEMFGKKNTNIAKKSQNDTVVVQFVSNCNSKSGREKIVKSLMQHMKVDVYGRCGSKSCNKLVNATKCYENMSKNYKFYLSFENSVCKDYITEKFFNILQYDVIPIVLNGANMTNIAPPHSHINIQDFNSTKHLAEYLMKVDKNDTLFASYFWWRDYYYVQAEFDVEPRQAGWCGLCRRLHQNTPTLKTLNLENILDTNRSCSLAPFIEMTY